ncbi:MAG: MFS transporter [Sphingobium sp.]
MRHFSIGWRQVWACLILMAVGAALIASAFSVVAVPLGKEFHPSRMVLMLAMTIMALVSALLSPWLGGLMDRMSLRRLMFMGAGSLVAGYVALSFTTSFTQVLIVYGVFMAPANILIGPIAASVLISRWFIKRRGAALGIVISGVALGGFLFPPMVQWLLDTVDWRVAFRVMAVLVGISAFAAITMVVDHPSDRGLHPDGAEIDPDEGRALVTGPELTTRAILSDKSFWFSAIVFAAVLSGMKGMVTNLMPLALDEGIAATAAALLISFYSACGFLSKLSFASVADKLNLRKLMFVSLGGFAVGMACLIRADAGYWTIVVGIGLAGLFGGMMAPMQGLLVPRIYGRHVVGKVSGLLNLVVMVALLSSPPVFGLIYDLTGNYDGIFLAYAVWAVAAMLLVPYIRMVPFAPLEEEGQGKDEVLGKVVPQQG